MTRIELYYFVPGQEDDTCPIDYDGTCPIDYDGTFVAVATELIGDGSSFFSSVADYNQHQKIGHNHGVGYNVRNDDGEIVASGEHIVIVPPEDIIDYDVIDNRDTILRWRDTILDREILARIIDYDDAEYGSREWLIVRRYNHTYLYNSEEIRIIDMVGDAEKYLIQEIEANKELA